MSEERLLDLSCWLALSYLRGIGRGTVHAIAARNRALGLPMAAFFEMPERDLVARYNVPADAELDMSRRKQALEIALRLTASVLRRGISVLTVADESYPAALGASLKRTAPPLLYVSGEPSLLCKAGIAVVGTRSPSRQAKRCARVCAEAIVAEGFTLVSGYADGIDTIAHIGALENGGTTTAVLPYGILRFHPKVDVLDLDKAPTRTVIVSEFAPDAPLSRHTALTRNRTICAFADAVLVVETQEKGGAVNAGRNALQLHKPLFVAAAQTRRRTPAGNRLLIEQGAKPLTVFGSDDTSALTPLFDAARRSRPPHPQLDLDL